jgi:hypothetical protein
MYNLRLRFLKYNPGEYFAPHMDGMYMRENGERSFVTIQLYLNQVIILTCVDCNPIFGAKQQNKTASHLMTEIQ